MKIVVTICMALLLLTGCKKSEEEVQLEEFLQTHYPATKVKIISIMIHLMPFQICSVMGTIVLKKNLILEPS